MIRQQIIDEALTWLDTPYHHKAMVKGIGVDCAMLVAAVAIKNGLLKQEDVSPNYSVQWHLHNTEEKLLEQLGLFGCVQIDEPKPGDIITFKYGRVTSHLGILINTNQVIHAREDVQKVVINDLGPELIERWTYTYKFPGVDE